MQSKQADEQVNSITEPMIARCRKKSNAIYLFWFNLFFNGSFYRNSIF